mmetsp:Transcript_31919/g.73748  ORF Transcript_31919/g.73748 Transcript_31919/m.73748 type:complete len:271 (+) Transcript_31919:136-948(+)
MAHVYPIWHPTSVSRAMALAALGDVHVLEWGIEVVERDLGLALWYGGHALLDVRVATFVDRTVGRRVLSSARSLGHSEVVSIALTLPAPVARGAVDAVIGGREPVQAVVRPRGAPAAAVLCLEAFGGAVTPWRAVEAVVLGPRPQPIVILAKGALGRARGGGEALSLAVPPSWARDTLTMPLARGRGAVLAPRAVLRIIGVVALRHAHSYRHHAPKETPVDRRGAGRALHRPPHSPPPHGVPVVATEFPGLRRGRERCWRVRSCSGCCAQ